MMMMMSFVCLSKKLKNNFFLSYFQNAIDCSCQVEMEALRMELSSHQRWYLKRDTCTSASSCLSWSRRKEWRLFLHSSAWEALLLSTLFALPLLHFVCIKYWCMLLLTHKTTKSLPWRCLEKIVAYISYETMLCFPIDVFTSGLTFGQRLRARIPPTLWQRLLVVATVAGFLRGDGFPFMVA